MRTPSKKISPLLVVGSIAFDTIRTPAGSARRVLGGSAVYFAAAARFFSPIKMIGVVGTDFSSSTLQALGRLGIDTGGIATQKGRTFHWKGYYETDLNQAFTQKTELNVFATFRPVLSAGDRGAAHIFLANIDPVLQLNVLNQARNPRWVACDTMNYWIRNARDGFLRVLREVDIAFMNDAEARELSGRHNLLQAARWLLGRGPSVAVIKKGEHGALCVFRGRAFFYPAHLLDDIADPTGAGDSFAGGFLGYLTRFRRPGEREIKNAMAHGAVVASFNVEKFGPERLFSLTKKEIDRRYAQYRRMITLE